MRSVVSLEMSLELGSLLSKIQTWEAQEMPLEQLRREELRLAVECFSDKVVRTISRELRRRCLVPKGWKEVVYVRRKELNQYTKRHQDFDFFRKRGYVTSAEEPAYTWWAPLSHLNVGMSRIHLFVGSKMLLPVLSVGDVLLFHQKVLHEASVHSSQFPRHSIDGRFLLREVLTADIASDRLTQSSLKAPGD
jgi:hypothetical protein